jgi:hypothetical protein
MVLKKQEKLHNITNVKTLFKNYINLSFFEELSIKELLQKRLLNFKGILNLFSLSLVKKKEVIRREKIQIFVFLRKFTLNFIRN